MVARIHPASRSERAERGGGPTSFAGRRGEASFPSFRTKCETHVEGGRYPAVHVHHSGHGEERNRGRTDFALDENDSRTCGRSAIPAGGTYPGKQGGARPELLETSGVRARFFHQVGLAQGQDACGGTFLLQGAAAEARVLLVEEIERLLRLSSPQRALGGAQRARLRTQLVRDPGLDRDGAFRRLRWSDRT